MSAKRGPKSPLSGEHKAAMAEGRAASRVVKAYLEAIGDAGRRTGKLRSEDDLKQRLGAIESEFADTDALGRLKLAQERIDIEAEIERRASDSHAEELEGEFVRVASGYSERQGITYQAWRAVGVPAKVLSSAGVRRR